jgi:acyl-CoA synthetase (AMP-forming)/AMP-acid ligase II
LEVEDAALSFASVSDCICIPVAHPVTGNALKLLVVPSPDADYSPKALAQFLKSRLQSHQVPLFYERVDHIKRTHNGKLNRKWYVGN